MSIKQSHEAIKAGKYAKSARAPSTTSNDRENRKPMSQKDFKDDDDSVVEQRDEMLSEVKAHIMM